MFWAGKSAEIRISRARGASWWDPADPSDNDFQSYKQAIPESKAFIDRCGGEDALQLLGARAADRDKESQSSYLVLEPNLRHVKAPGTALQSRPLE